ncbi:disease resistance protein RUN1 isoform X2 [Eucalyptus grandis]|uniref:disease resistance protein RUN1 isoform X2 n=1 Tax=Eucalyptus grandis TaxID=71139 RepID=UPI00192EFDBB|nr:disease resistance protein RUN1 isoform X2 [Eucalyptus grandis]
MAPEVVAAGRKRKSPEPPSGINHEVFLNFRGADTREGFTDLLHRDLQIAGIEVFRDDKKLLAGEEIHLGLKKAIKQSRISIAIFSKDYASSKSCLMELVQMWECRQSNGQTIIPIFYDVSPDAVKHQTGDFATSFKKHEDDKVDPKTIQNWKKVLQLVGGLSGYERDNINGRHVTDLLDKVMTRVRQELKEDDQDVPDKLVGIDLHVQWMMTKLDVVYSRGQAMKVCGEDRRVVGICGMPGVGKTTLAKVVFNKIHKLFHACSFLNGVNSGGVEFSQELLIADLQKEKREPLRSSGKVKKLKSLFTNMKVLIVLDDVREDEQIKALAGDLTWFGPGSRIIVTTHRRDVLKVFDFGEEDKDRAAAQYDVKPMEYQDALKLFRMHVFQGDAPQDVSECDSLSPDIVEALGMLPMAIKLQASYLKSNKERSIWQSSLKSLQKYPLERKVEAAFEASYKSLDDCAQKIYLDIACFFIGKDERIPPYMWEEAWHGDPLRIIKHLRDMHFLEDGENNEFRMHDLLRDYGRKLVKGCRIWNHSDALSILKDGQGHKTPKANSLHPAIGSGIKNLASEPLLKNDPDSQASLPTDRRRCRLHRLSPASPRRAHRCTC